MLLASTDSVSARMEVIMSKKKMLVTELQVSFLKLMNSIVSNRIFFLEIGEYCRFDNNCIGNDTHCKYGKCRCPYGTHPNEDYTVCLKNVSLGGNCTSDDECTAEDSRCHSVCRCKTSHIVSADGKECLPSKKFPF
jgi:hypothetical protein